MKKKLSMIIAITMLCLSLMSLLVACDTEAETALSLYILEIDGQTVTEEFILPKTISDLDATWTSNKENVTITARDDDYLATITRPNEGVEEVTLTVKISRSTKTFTVRVPAIDVYDIADSFYFAQNKKTVAAGEFDLASSTTYNGKTATIAWEVKSGSESYLSISGDKCKVTCTGDNADVSLIAKFTYNNETATKTYKFTVSASASLLDLFTAEIVTSPVVGTSYKLAIYQALNKAVIYAKAEMSGNYLATTTSVSEAADLVLEAADGGYYLKLGNSYITLTGALSGTTLKAYISLTDTASTVFSIGDSYVLSANVAKTGDDGNEYTGTFYIGTYSSYATVSASAISYISGDNATKIDDSQFPARILSSNEIKVSTGDDNEEDASTKDTFLASVVSAPVAGTAYKMAMYQATNDAVYYATGAMNGYYLATTTNVSEAADLVLEAADGGYYIKLGDNYLTIVGRLSSGKLSTSISLTETASTVFTIGANSSFNVALTMDNDGTTLEGTFYLGTYGSNVTIGASNVSFITGDNAANVDVSQYVVRAVTVDASAASVKDTFLASIVTAPVAGTSYKMAMYQAANDAIYYATGEMNGYYLATTTDASAAAVMVLEATDGGYYIKLGDNYLTVVGRLSNSKLSTSISLTATASTVFTIGENSSLNVALTMDNDGTTLEGTFYLGTYGSNVTIGASNVSYITGNNAANVDVSQYVVRAIAD